MTADPSAIVEAPALPVLNDERELNADERYSLVSQHFPEWLLAEPIEFPPTHPTFGWACRVPSCEGAISITYSRQLCDTHRRQLYEVRDSIDFETFLAQAEPLLSNEIGWGLRRRPDCTICGTNREGGHGGFCRSHLNSLMRARRQGVSDADWRKEQHPYPAMPQCAVPKCLRDGEQGRFPADPSRLCSNHSRLAKIWQKDEVPQQKWTSEIAGRWSPGRMCVCLVVGVRLPRSIG